MKSYLLALVFLIGFVYMPESYGQQTASTPDSDLDTIISLQIILRDSDDHLITYLNIQKLGYLNRAGLDEFLNYEAARGQDSTFTVGDTTFQMIRRTITYTYDSQTVISDITLNDVQNGKTVTLIRPIHDGIPGEEGDTLTTVWTFIRPVN